MPKYHLDIVGTQTLCRIRRNWHLATDATRYRIIKAAMTAPARVHRGRPVELAEPLHCEDRELMAWRSLADAWQNLGDDEMYQIVREFDRTLAIA